MSVTFAVLTFLVVYLLWKTISAINETAGNVFGLIVGIISTFGLLVIFSN